MFENLDRIDWKSLGYHTYGRHEQIPIEIRNLLSTEPEVREEAREFLLGGGQDFGDIYDTTPHIIPFLIEVLDNPDAPDKDSLLFHLSGVADQVAYQRHSSIPMMRLRLQTYDAFKAGLGSLMAMLNAPALEIRLAGAEFLGHMTDEVESLIPELIRRFREAHEEEYQVALMSSLKRLLNSLEWPRFALRGQYAPFFKETVETHPSHTVRVAAARASVELVGDYASKETNLSAQVPVLLSQEFRDLSTPLDYQESGSSLFHEEMLARDLSRVAPEPLVQLLHEPAINARQAHLITRALLASVFLHKELVETYWGYYPDHQRETEGLFYFQSYPPRNSLKFPYQIKSRFLQAIVDAEKVWEIPTNLFSFFYGLPDSREEMRTLLVETTDGDHPKES